MGIDGCFGGANMDHDDFMKRLLEDARAQKCLNAAVARKEAGSMVPIEQHITPDLLEAVYPELVGLMIDAVKQHETMGAAKVIDAIKGTEGFKHLMNCAIACLDDAPMSSQSKGRK
jgi:hypothetical protein